MKIDLNKKCEFLSMRLILYRYLARHSKTRESRGYERKRQGENVWEKMSTKEKMFSEKEERVSVQSRDRGTQDEFI